MKIRGRHLGIFWIFFLSGCASNQVKNNQNIEPKVLLSSEDRKDGLCLAAFDYGGQLVVVNRERKDQPNVYQLTFYEPRNGLFSHYTQFQARVGKCSLVTPYQRLDSSRELNLFEFKSKAAKGIFDGAFENPTALLKLVTVGPPHMTGDGRYEREQTATLLKKTYSDGGENLSDYLRKVTPEQIDSYRDAVRKKEEQFNQEMKQIAYEKEQILKPWNDRLKAIYKIGDQVCTFNKNIFGNVETIQADKIKIHAIGRVASMDGYFFSVLKKYNFNYDKIEAPRWTTRDEIAHCGFSSDLRQ